MSKKKTLFEYDLKTGKLIITPYAKKFYKEQGKNPKEEAKLWLNQMKINGTL